MTTLVLTIEIYLLNQLGAITLKGTLLLETLNNSTLSFNQRVTNNHKLLCTYVSISHSSQLLNCHYHHHQNMRNVIEELEYEYLEQEKYYEILNHGFS